MSTSPVQQDIFGVLAPFIVACTALTAVPLGQSQVLQELPNREAMPPASPGFVVMTMLGMRRLRTNINTWAAAPAYPTAITHEAAFKIHVQVDFYGATSMDWAAAFATLFRDDSGFRALAPICAPLYADEARMAPLDDSEDQYERRWSVDAYLDYSPTTTDAMQFADTLTVTTVNVDETYPP